MSIDTSVSLPQVTHFSIFVSVDITHAPGETRTRKLLRATDFKSVVYADSTTGATSLDEKSPLWVRGDTIYFSSHCHPQYEFVSSNDTLLTGNFPCAVTMASQQRGVIRSGGVKHILPRIGS